MKQLFFLRILVLELHNTVLSFFFILLISPAFYAQSQRTAIWYFGNNKAGVTFASGSPVAITNGQLTSDEGCASICDAAGNLLFYTNGVSVWNNTHNVMPNGTGLTGNINSAQSALIVPIPGTSSQYYIFTTPANGADSLRYSLVDMTLAGGLGDIVSSTKNIGLYGMVEEKLTGVYHSNGTDIWVVTHGYMNNTYVSFLVTSAGINAPVFSAEGTVCSSGGNGYMKLAPNGTKIARANSFCSNAEVCDFNNSTGNISNPISFASIPGCYGTEFSSGSGKLYFTSQAATAKIYQYDLLAGNAAAIIASQVIINSTAYPSPLQLGLDGKIYTSEDLSQRLGVINCPDAAGIACNYVPQSINLGVVTDNGLPNFIQSYFMNQGSAVFVNGNTSLCAGDATTLSATGGATYSWSTGETTSSINISPSSTTTYAVITTSASGCPNTASASVTVTVSPPLIVNITPTNSPCRNSNGSAVANVSGGISPYIYLWSPPAGGQTTPTATGLITGTYTVTVTDANECTQTQSVTIINGNGPTAMLSSQTNVSCNGGTNGNAIVSASGGIPGYTYSWNTTPVQTNAMATGLTAGIYIATVTDAGGCTSTQVVTITQPPPITASAGTGITITMGGSTTLLATGGGTYSWYPSTGLSCITCANPVVTPPFGGQGGLLYCVTVTDANNCTSSACVTVQVETDCSNTGDLFIPNAFSPNGDGENDSLHIYYGNIKCIRTYKLTVYNRWGEKVFETTDITRCWDGTHRDKPLNTAVFVYYMEATLTNGEKITKKGNVSLIR